ncbi:PQQ-dependent dehydrogenase (methanol/ethanol family) [Pseudoduganella flava]|uniref:PQQ-dependent dehydrogenase (Methanol/ethanol family) n=1 Tax=Pseudoduganella flava TaxID=871742 RepID=A0A562PVK2_9BURK|nr:methanol/ethanol family PQQ-dependent dehydrogenase [Pseudoduganella flava]QGZ39554.1 PQQ-dependent dehydrogenase, methanol/ethanol family [Pseudoduganella flava]TWI48449.1 PQQ-dependent dehydrogenase (methanol/ethanol family) [Pseudoduganella flava]
MFRAFATIAWVSCLLPCAAATGEWTMAPGDYANTRFAALAQITPANVKSLKPAFTFDVGVHRGQEAAPLVVGATMYVLSPYPNYLYALDVANNGRKKWVFDPQPGVGAEGVACCDLVTRGVAYDNGRIFMVTLDGQAIAVDANKGTQLWRTKLADIAKGETVTMAPLVVKGKVLIGNSGGELGVRGWLVALDAGTGKEVWRAWSTGPDKDVLIGSGFQPFYEQDRGRDLGVSTWPPDAWKIGGGNVWGWISYDPEADLIYYGTANPGPWNPEQRPGDNKWTAGIFARKPDTGEARWFYQWSPHDLHDYDGVNENVLVDLAIGGKPRKVLVHPDRNGYVYVLDRMTGQVLSADAFVDVTTSLGVDLATGKLRYNPAKAPRVGEVIRNLCPVSPGAKDWQPSAWSPRTKLLYIPHQNLCQDTETYDVAYIAGTPYVGVDNKMYAAPGRTRGAFTAWDPVARKARWSIQERFPVWSGALATAGDVVFYGTMDGWFKAVDARDGKPLWQFKVSSGIIGQPVSYLGPDGKQYVAVLAGVGGWAGAIVSGDLDPRDGTAAKGFVNVMKDLPHYTGKGGMLYVFALP